MSAFVRGQLVLVERTARNGEGGWGNSWVSNMNRAVGQVARVQGDGINDLDVRLDVPGVTGVYGYPEFVLMPVSQGPVSNEDWDRFKEDL